MVYTHSHGVDAPPLKINRQTAQHTITEKCLLCDAMHHNTVVVNAQHYMAPLGFIHREYTAITYTFVSFSLILSTGRAPPLS